MHLHFLSVSQDCSKLTVRTGAILGVLFFLFVKYPLGQLLCVRCYLKAYMARDLEVGGLVGLFWLGMP